MFRPPLLIPAALAALLAAPLAADPAPGDPPVELRYDPAELPATPGESDPDRVRTAEATRRFVTALFSENRPPVWSSWKTMRLGPTAGGKTRAELLSADGDLHGWHWLDTAALAGVLKDRELPAGTGEDRRFAVGTGAAVPAAGGGDASPDPALVAELPGLWEAEDLGRFLSGKMIGAESLIITEVNNGAGFGSAEGRGRVRFRVNRTDGTGPFSGEIELREARRTLADYGLSAKVGEVLRPTADAGGGDDAGPTELPGTWRDGDMNRFLSGEMPWVASLTVTAIDDAGAGPGGGGRGTGRVTFRMNRVDGTGPFLGEMDLSEAREELGYYGLSAKVGETLRPVGTAGPKAAGGSGGFFAPPGNDSPFEFPKAARRSPSPDVTAAVAAVRDAGGDAKAAAEDKLDALLAEQFDAAQKEREEALAALESKVRRLRSLHDKRAAAKAEIVARRADTLLREADGLGWGEPGGVDAPRAAPGGGVGPGVAFPSEGGGFSGGAFGGDAFGGFGKLPSAFGGGGNSGDLIDWSASPLDGRIVQLGRRGGGDGAEQWVRINLGLNVGAGDGVRPHDVFEIRPQVREPFDPDAPPTARMKIEMVTDQYADGKITPGSLTEGAEVRVGDRVVRVGNEGGDDAAD